MQGMWVRSLAGELRSHMSPAQYSLLEENKPANSPHSEERECGKMGLDWSLDLVQFHLELSLRTAPLLDSVPGSL